MKRTATVMGSNLLACRNTLVRSWLPLAMTWSRVSLQIFCGPKEVSGNTLPCRMLLKLKKTLYEQMRVSVWSSGTSHTHGYFSYLLLLYCLVLSYVLANTPMQSNGQGWGPWSSLIIAYLKQILKTYVSSHHSGNVLMTDACGFPVVTLVLYCTI